MVSLVGAALVACSGPKPTPPIKYVDAGPILDPCGLPGSWVHDDAGFHEVPAVVDAGPLADLSWMTIPVGFCVHPYGIVPNVRQIRFAPGGELFAASPSRPVASGVTGGLGEVVVLPDDNADGYGDSVLTYAKWANTQGLLFANGSLYYQDLDHGSPPYPAGIWKEPYQIGQRADLGGGLLVADITVNESGDHWPKTLDIADDGTVYVGNGGDQDDQCQSPMPFIGGILSVGSNPAGEQVAMGFRNPIAVKCHRDGNDHCFALELGKDGSGSVGGREKLVPIHSGDNWGFPCCASTNVPYDAVTCPDGGPNCGYDCSGITPETNAFLIGNTPFGFDFSDSNLPSPWNDSVVIALHGAVGSWVGARVVAIQLDSTTDLPLQSSTTDGDADEGAIADFATGWDDGRKDHGRPADVAFSLDGRMFVSNDETGQIVWFAPIGTKAPPQ